MSIRLHKKVIGISLFVLFPYFFDITMSYRGLGSFIVPMSFVSAAIMVLMFEERSIILRNEDILWIGPVLTVIFSSKGINSAAIKYATYFTLGIIAMLLLRRKYRKMAVGLKLLRIMAVMTAVSVIVDRFFPNFWPNIIYVLYTPEARAVAENCERGHYHTGMFYAVADTAGFLVNGFAMFIFCKFNSKKTKVFMLLILIYGIVLTNKRAHLLMACSSFFVIRFLESKQIKKIKIVILGAALLVILLKIIIILYEAQIIVKGNIRLLDSIYVTATNLKWDVFWNELNRQGLYENAIDHYRQHKLFGIGWWQYVEGQKVGGENVATHNIYLQLLCETGIIGVTTFLIPFILQYAKTIKFLRYVRNVELKEYLRISLYIQTFFFTYGLTGNPLYDNNYLFAYFLGVAISEMCIYECNAAKGIERMLCAN